MHFSARTPTSLEPNPLSRAVEAKQKYGAKILDLTESNPTRAGIPYPAATILESLGDERALLYRPDPLGALPAREAIARYYRERGVEVPLDRIVLTSSTSEAYTLLFKLLCDPGDRVAVPIPSYPLFEHLARAEGVAPVFYPLVYEGAWRIDIAALEEAVDDRTRAVVLVSPNNPTGSSLFPDDLARLVALCRRHDIAIVCDEVFADYAEPSPRRVRTTAGVDGALTFTLNGLSKIAGLPQLKLGWIVSSGPAPVLREALERLEFLADLFLSVGTPVQMALPRLLALAPSIQHSILARMAANRSALERALERQPAWRAVSEPAGWYVVLQYPRIVPEEALVLELLERTDVLVHPGYFFDFRDEGLAVLSLITPEETFAEGLSRLFAVFDELTR